MKGSSGAVKLKWSGAQAVPALPRGFLTRVSFCSVSSGVWSPSLEDPEATAIAGCSLVSPHTHLVESIRFATNGPLFSPGIAGQFLGTRQQCFGPLAGCCAPAARKPSRPKTNAANGPSHAMFTADVVSEGEECEAAMATTLARWY